MYTVLSLSLILVPQLSDYLHRLTPCYIRQDLFCMVYLRCLRCVCCVSSAQSPGVIQKHMGDRVGGDVKGQMWGVREFNAFSSKAWTQTVHHLVCLMWLTHRPKSNIYLMFRPATEDREDTAKETWPTDDGRKRQKWLPPLCDRQPLLGFSAAYRSFWS